MERNSCSLQRKTKNQGVRPLQLIHSPVVVGGRSEASGGKAHPILDNIKNNCSQRFTHDCKKLYHNFWFEGTETGKKLPFLCHQWGCATCNYNKRWSLKFKIDEIAHHHNTRYFITLTMARDVSLEYAHKYFSHVFAKFRYRFRRKHGENFKFIRITELHKDGYPHFHILTHQRVNVNWLRESWVGCGGGKIMKSIYLKPQKKGDDWKVAISKYLSKYFSKADHILPKGYRHYTTNYKVPPKPEYTPPERFKLMVEWGSKTGKKIIYQADKFDFGCAWFINAYSKSQSLYNQYGFHKQQQQGSGFLKGDSHPDLLKNGKMQVQRPRKTQETDEATVSSEG